MGMILQHELFGPGTKYVKFHEGGLSAIEAANTVAKMPLNDLRIQYDQFARASIIVPKNAKNVPVNLQELGTATTMLVIKVRYDVKNRDLAKNSLEYKLGEINVTKYSFTDLLVLTGTVTTPVPPLFVDNPSKTHNVTLEVFACTTMFDSVSDYTSFDLFIKDLLYTDLRSADSYTTAVYKAGQVEAYFSNVFLVNVEIVENRLLFDDPAVGRVCLQFIDVPEARQALSAMKWMLDSPTTRVLTSTTPRDLTPPEIVFFSNIVDLIGLSLTARLPLPLAQTQAHVLGATQPAAGELTKAAIVAGLVETIIDDRDGAINLLPSSVTVRDMHSMTYSSISEEGVYTVMIKLSDIAGNEVVKIISLTVTDPITSGPLIVLTPHAIGDPLSYTFQNSLSQPVLYVTKQEMISTLIISCRSLAGSNIVVLPSDLTIISGETGEPVIEAAYPGYYELYIDVTDASNNTTSLYIDIALAN